MAIGQRKFATDNKDCMNELPLQLLFIINKTKPAGRRIIETIR